MTTHADIHPVTPHTLKILDDELNHLHDLIVEMAILVMFQLDQTMLALDEGNLPLAGQVMARDTEVKRYEAKIDAEVLSLLARHCPVASDLRSVISATRIAVELLRIGAEIADFARLVTVLFAPETSDPNPKLLSDIVKIGNLLKIMLGILLLVLERQDSDDAYTLLQYDSDCERELREGIKHQLFFVMQDARMIGRALDIMHIMKSLERCGEHCRNIAEYLIFMIDGIDVRHRLPVLKLNL